MLDFLTLYIIILLNSLLFVVVWAGFVVTYRQIPGARLWLAASCSTMVGGLLFAGDGGAWGRAFSIAGNMMVVLGFCLMWSGVRKFYGAAPKWRTCGGLVALSVVLGLVAGPERPGQNIAYAVAQMLPIALAFLDLRRLGGGSFGARIAMLAVFISFLGQGTEATLNMLRIVGLLSTEAYYSVAALLLIAVICGAGLWNFGYLLMAIDRLSEKLAALARCDDLTRLPNRRAFFERAERDMRLVRRRVKTGRAERMSLFLLDLDHFKQINDSSGHAVGDACLCHFAQVASDICLQHLGEDGGLARLGGDEFGLVARGLSPQDEAALARAILQALAETPLVWREWPIYLSSSIGIAAWPVPGEGEKVPANVARLVERADMALYEVKRRGRNNYARAETLPDTPEPEDQAGGVPERGGLETEVPVAASPPR
ncbi:GGDEF domain-containing protein [Xanthobacter sp. TB0139]|uniref:GGDEF domain-containing protein n=1 Tax=Xanthobacter sp. TB0139 TaxID=3459178 RepID=UPI00403A5121